MWRGSCAKKANNGLVLVAVDNDKNSLHALKWAVKNLIDKEQIFHLLHVRKQSLTIKTPTGRQLLIAEVDEKVASAIFDPINSETEALLLPFRCYCSIRGLHWKEIVLDSLEVPKAIIDYVAHQSVDQLVLGASSRNAFMRAFKHADVPTTVSKLAPEFCSVYVVAKANISSFRPAPSPNKHPICNASHKIQSRGHSYRSPKSEPVARKPIGVKSALSRSVRVGHDHEGDFGPRTHDEITNGIFNTVGQGWARCISSSPTSGRHSIYRPFNYSMRDHKGPGTQSSWMSKLHNECSYRDEQMSSSELNRSGGCNGSEFSPHGYEHAPVLKEAAGASWSLSSGATDLYSMRAEEENNFSGEATKKHGWQRSGEMQGANCMQGMETTTSSTDRDNRLEDESRKIMYALSAKVKYRRYTIDEIKMATNNFSDALKIGEGGYGSVFKATLGHTLAAIKVLQSDPTQGLKQFQQEVEVLSSIRHPNLVLLMGACPDNGCLVYEYMSNGNLEDRLFCQNNTPPLSWQLRFKIAAEMATALLFLHQNKPEPVVHRDLKPANILLDHNFVSKIADVGLARLVPSSVANSSTQSYMTAAAGTFCYIDPEYQMTGRLGIKSDIYALGIIFLQLITAKPPMGLIHHMEGALEMGQIEGMLDPAIPDWPMEDTTKFAKLALKCSELQRKDRPDLESVILPELSRLRALADESQRSVKHFHHVKTWYRQDTVNISGQAYAKSMIVPPTRGFSFLQRAPEP